jgi:formylglycine-generating enzyme required for sulfatase activity
VTWFDARAFCESRGTEYDLPTEAQWEYAARGPNSLVYPWGNEYIADNVIGKDDPTYGDTSTAPVGSRPEGTSWVGALGMSGNVWEWTLSEYRDYPYDADDGRNDNLDSTGVDRVLRGGSFNNDTSFLRAAYRLRNNAVNVLLNIGFRCVRNYAG